MNRMRRVLAAAKQAELLQLGKTEALVRAARARAMQLRESSRTAVTGSTASDMAALGVWQAHAEALARDAEAEARALEQDMKAMQDQLSRTLGRETVVDALIRRASAEARQISERRTEDAPRPGASSVPGASSSSAGIA